MKQFVIICLGVLTAVATSSAGDNFTAIKERLKKAACVHFDFVSIIDSDVFDTSDSTLGSADIAQDGRFNVTIGTDQYLYDLTHLYTYSQSADQVVIEEPQQDVFTGSEIAFVTRLDDYFKTITIKIAARYMLVKTDPDEVDLPDTLGVHLDENGERIEELQFLDINGDLNTIVINKQTTSDSCRASLFVPDFPDSVERVRL